MNGPILGIDLGTTGSLVAVVQGGEPRILPNSLGERITPSAVSVLDDGTFVVGAAARARSSTHAGRTAVQFKRDMGTDTAYHLGDQTLKPVVLSALVLQELKASAEAALGHEIVDAVITVPAYFGEHQRHATKEAGRIAGLTVHRILNEPTAAALAYGLTDLDREVKAVVLDLGGGTFDVTVLEIIAGVVEVQSSAGDARLGGEDFSDALADLLAEGVDLAPIARPRLREAADRLKVRLTGIEADEVVLEDLMGADGQPVTLRKTVRRADVEAAWIPLLERLRAPIEQALRDARWRLGDIDEVLLVGGATRMPAVRRLVARLFGRPPRVDLQPDETVALGAAVQAALLAGDEAVEDLVATDVAPFTMGTTVVVHAGGRMLEDRYEPMIERGTVIPTSRSGSYQTVHPDQRSVDIKVWQGEHPTASRNTFLGNLHVQDLEPRGPGLSAMFEIRFTYDLNGLLEVEVTPEGKAPHRLVIEGAPGRLTAEQIAEAQAQMAKLKVHPRELLPNATALAQAEALYAQLLGRERDRLVHAINGFEAALLAQEPREIERARNLLNAVVDDLS